VLARGLAFETEHPTEGRLKQLGLPIRFSDREPAGERLPAPLLGEHTESVLEELGYTSDEMNRLKRSGAV
jgi:formyl-CoA transferase